MEPKTKQNLLDAAELLFSQGGIRATSLRAITAAAGANLAAVNYHFGNKDGLVRAVLARRLGPMTEARFRQLSESKAAGSDLEGVIRAFVLPVLSLIEESEKRGDDLPRFIGRSHFEADEGIHEYFLEQFRPTMEAFLAALHPLLPRLSAEEIFCRLLFAVGTLMTSINLSMFEADEHLDLDLGRTRDTLTDGLVSFLVAGFQAPPVMPERSHQ